MVGRVYADRPTIDLGSAFLVTRIRRPMDMYTSTEQLLLAHKFVRYSIRVVGIVPRIVTTRFGLLS